MFWATGQRIMKAAAFVKERKDLFGFYITNFSCGPDSFLLTYFRDLMAGKPSLTLELDQHTANAGIDTRIEAALDIMQSYHRLGPARQRPSPHVRPARVEEHDGSLTVLTSDGERLPLTHPRVEVVIPSMGFYGTQAVAAVMRGVGIAARALPVADREALLAARRNASCKECLPYLVTLGSFLSYLEKKQDHSKVTLCFLPTGGGPCRLGQYCRAVEAVFHRLRLANAALFTLTDENGYAGLGVRALLRGWQGIVTADVLEDVRSFLGVAAVRPAAALAEVDACWREVVTWLEGRTSVRYTVLLSLVADRLARIATRRGLHEVPVVSVVGEYYVRKDLFSRRNLVDYLQSHGFMVKVAPAMEYLCYSTRNILHGLQEGRTSPLQRFKTAVQARLQEWWEQRIKSAIARSGLYRFEMTDVERTIAGAAHLVSDQFRGEALLTVGSALREILDESCGVVAIGPFGCMPSRVAESILVKEMNGAGKRRMALPGRYAEAFAADEEFPFLSIETDGNAFPQVVQANLEAFVLRARRLHTRLTELEGRKVVDEGEQVGRTVGIA
jgi:predicted nucleotide-binding protein (sugar kinase/HSP70/actin superfamily)